ncbi:MAG: ribonuclease Y [Deltaproteobacteria bacterium]|nr:MAG: ribonuclease Y [Deltaproteobacteria bacterium]
MVLAGVAIFAAASAAGLVLGIWWGRRALKGKLREAERQASEILKEAERQAEIKRKEASLQAKEEAYRIKAEVEREMAQKREELLRLEKRLQQRENNIDKRVDLLDAKEAELERKEGELKAREQRVQEKERQYEELLQEERQRLEHLSGVTAEEAKKLLMERMEEEAKYEAAKRIKEIEDELREQATKRAQEIIALAVQRYAGEYVAEKTVSLVNLPAEEMKGRIIGREGRNIRAFEAATGVDLIIDDTPEAVIVSSFNPVRREVARLALERLVSDGRIHPARIEEVVSQVEEEIEQSIKEAGNQAAFDLGIHDLHPELIKLVGRLKYRTSYGQNVYQHSLEVAFLCGIMAAELNLNVKQAKRAGLLHDIGKAVDHEVEGGHAAIGAELARKYGESEEIIRAIAAHHDEPSPDNLLAVLVQAADALSGARPGARREMYETYVKRLQDLERIGRSFPGVEKAYAIQAGREVRVIVYSDRVSDEEALMLSREVAKKIEKELHYPGQIKVTVIREVRAVDYAK